MSITRQQSNVEIITAFADAINRHDLDSALALVADDAVYLASLGPEFDGATFRGREEFCKGFAALMEIYPDMQYKDLQWVIDGDNIAVGWTMTGTDSRSGQPFEVRGCDLFRLENGKIVLKDAFRKARNG